MTMRICYVLIPAVIILYAALLFRCEVSSDEAVA